MKEKLNNAFLVLIAISPGGLLAYLPIKSLPLIFKTLFSVRTKNDFKKFKISILKDCRHVKQISKNIFDKKIFTFFGAFMFPCVVF